MQRQGAGRTRALDGFLGTDLPRHKGGTGPMFPRHCCDARTTQQPLRTLIANKLEKSGVLPLQTAKIRGFMPMGRSDVTSMYDEFLPPGLLLGSNYDNAGG